MTTTMTVGRVRIDRVLEHEMATRPPAQMFPAHLRGGLAAEIERSAGAFAVKKWGFTT
ncbi:hypothetical protein [Kitasatospora sp. GAS1066B]|uniref:hypothetical protein n=1 Tax=Kitasatospora sp. GAS1066B TaxID=3156271 RepID=UPI00351641A4